MYTVGSPQPSRVMRWPIRARSIASTNVMRDTPPASRRIYHRRQWLTFWLAVQIQNSKGSPVSVSVNPVVSFGTNPVPCPVPLRYTPPGGSPAPFLDGNPIESPAERMAGREVRHRVGQRPIAIRPRRMVKVVLRNDMGQCVRNSYVKPNAGYLCPPQEKERLRRRLRVLPMADAPGLPVRWGCRRHAPSRQSARTALAATYRESHAGQTSILG